MRALVLAFASSACLQTVDPKAIAAAEAAAAAGTDAGTKAPGVPPDAQLVPSGPITLTDASPTVTNMDVQGGIVIRTNRARISRSRITTNGDYGVLVDVGFQQALIEDVEVIGGKVAAIGPGGFRAVRVDVHDYATVGVALASSMLEDSIVHAPKSGSRAAVESRGGHGIVIVNSTLDTSADGVAHAVRIVSSLGPLADVEIRGSLLIGGSPIVEVSSGGNDLGGVRFIDNRIGPGTAHGELPPGVTWSDNRSSVNDTEIVP